VVRAGGVLINLGGKIECSYAWSLVILYSNLVEVDSLLHELSLSTSLNIQNLIVVGD
jgi:hypothetical protein